MRLLRVPISENAALKRSPHNFTQCASSTRRATKSSLYLINKTIVKQHQSLFYNLSFWLSDLASSEEYKNELNSNIAQVSCVSILVNLFKAVQIIEDSNNRGSETPRIH